MPVAVVGEPAGGLLGDFFQVVHVHIQRLLAAGRL
jgi:hypothetical protein